MGFISEETIRRVAEANDIVEVVGSYFPLKRAGTGYVALCPFHREKSPSFSVNPSRQTFHCFGCHAGGGVLRFVMDYEHLDFPTAVRRMAQRAGIAIVEDVTTEAEDQQRSLRRRLLALHGDVADWFHRNLLRSPSASTAREYLKSRGITSDIAKSWQLGYAPDSWDAVLEFLREQKFSAEEIAQSGLSTTREGGGAAYSRFRDRVMFPIRNDYGEVIAFSGRVLDPEAKTAKYVNSPETPLFTKGKVLYGLDKTKRDLIEKGAAIVCEGQLDLISAYEAGVRNVIAPQGTAFTSDQARLLRRFVETVMLCFDSDNAGQQATARSVPALLSQGLAVKVVLLPAGQDPDSLIRSKGPDAFMEAVAAAKDFFDHAADHAESTGGLSDPAAKSRLVRSLGPPLALVQDAALREAVLGRLATRLALPHTVIRANMKAPSMDGDATDKPAEKPDEIVLSPGLAILCRLALQSAEVREWLRGCDTSGLDDPNAPLLAALAAADFPDTDPAAASRFLATLAPSEERVLSALGLSRPMPEPLTRARKTWSGLISQRLLQEVDGLKNRLADPGLPSDQRLKIQKQILDLKIRVSDVSRPSQ